MVYIQNPSKVLEGEADLYTEDIWDVLNNMGTHLSDVD